MNIETFALQLRKHAAAHQSGMSLKEAKHCVDETVQAMRDMLGSDKSFQVTKWTELLEALEKFKSATADPSWRTVINHAKFRIKSRRSTLIYPG